MGDFISYTLKVDVTNLRLNRKVSNPRETLAEGKTIFHQLNSISGHSIM